MNNTVVEKLDKFIRYTVFTLFAFLIPIVLMIVTYKPFGIIGEAISFLILFFAYLRLYKYAMKTHLYNKIYNLFGSKNNYKSYEFFTSMMAIGQIISFFGLIGCILTSITLTTIKFI